MTPPFIEPLDPVTWFRRVEHLLDKAEQVDGEGPDSVIRTAYHLIALAPRPLRDLFPEPIDEDAIEAMLQCGGYESAVLALVGRQVAFKAERILHSDLIEVVMSFEHRSITGSARHWNCALAMLRAWAQCLVNFEKTARALNQADLAPRKFQSESLPKSTEH